MGDRTKYLDRAKDGRIYFRIHGKRERLQDDETSPEFAAAYDALIAGRMAPKPPREKRRTPDMPRSIGCFIKKCLASDYFVSRDGRAPKFKAGTQLNYRPVLEAIRRKLGPARLADL